MPGPSVGPSMEAVGQPAGEPELVEISWNKHYLEVYVQSIESIREVAFIVKEVIEENCYFKHGIMIREGATVIDIGANIGLFGVKAMSLVPGGDVTYIGVEPCPHLFDTLKRNLLGSDSSTSDSSMFHFNEVFEHVVQPAADGRISAAYPGNVQLFKVAVSSQSGTAPVTYYPQVPGNSTLRPAEKQHLQGSIMRHLLQDSQTYEVHVITLHQLLHEAQAVNQQIDLLKIDVEGEELNVLLGMGKADWAYVQQVVVEVHDVLPGEIDEATAMCAAAASTEQVATAGSAAVAAAVSTSPDTTAAPEATVALPVPSHDAIEGTGVCTRSMDSPAVTAVASPCRKSMTDDWITIASGNVSCEGPTAKAPRGRRPPEPRNGGRVLQVAHLLKSFGFRVVIECSLVIDDVTANYTVYAKKCL